MKQKKEKLCGLLKFSLLPKTRFSKKPGKIFFLCAAFLLLAGGVYAQIDFPEGDFWSLDAGVGVSGTKARGTSIQGILDPKLWLSPPLMVGARLGVSYGIEESSTLSDTLSFEGQVYLRWNFLRLGNPKNTVNIFAQAGLGILATYRGDKQPFDNDHQTRGSVLADAALGVTIPLSDRWHIEPQVRGGYPHLWGFSLTAGYKFPLPEKTKYIQSAPEIQYREVIRTLPPNEIIKRIMISSVEFILFGPDIGKYNLGIDHDAQELNEMVLNETAQFLKDHPECRVRIEGHANPVTTDPKEADELMALSSLRANAVVEQLKTRGVPDEQMVVIAFGGTRTVTSDRGIWDRNRRVELIVLQVDPETN